MAIFDSIGKKITETSQDAIQKTKELTEIAKINTCISEEEKNIEQSKKIIGELVYENFRTKTEEEIAEGIKSDAIKNWEAITNEICKCMSSEKNIQLLNEKIKKLKGIDKCPACGNEVPYDAAFCNHCGNKLEIRNINSSDEKYCPECGTKILGDAVFCTNCGKKINE